MVKISLNGWNVGQHNIFHALCTTTILHVIKMLLPVNDLFLIASPVTFTVVLKNIATEATFT